MKSRSILKIKSSASFRILITVTLILLLSASPLKADEKLSGDDELVKKIDNSLERAARFILDAQDVDGAWRSSHYGCFREGPELTPYVLSSLFFLPQGGDKAKASFQKGVDYLITMVGPDGMIRVPPQGFAFPVHTSSMASRVVVLASKDGRHLRAQEAWLNFLLERRLGKDLGWETSDPQFGGWGFSIRLPRKELKIAGEPFVESNLSATLFGIAALRSAKIPATFPVYKELLLFVERCQNFSPDPAQGDPLYDDGGFFFMPDDEGQNKAGLAGIDRKGKRRFHSYGSMTADGLRALIRLGLPLDHPRVLAAKKWLEHNFSVTENPGTFTEERMDLRNSYYYYYLWALAHALQCYESAEIMTKDGRISWAREVSLELLRRQKDNGTWVNEHTDAKEDDPLVGTPWGASVLSICRQMMTGQDRTLFPRATAPRK
jgi:hypothetical protein